MPSAGQTQSPRQHGGSVPTTEVCARTRPAALTVLVTQIPVHGPDVQPKRVLPFQWLGRQHLRDYPPPLPDGRPIVA